MVAMQGAAQPINPSDHLGLVYFWANRFAAKNPHLETGYFISWAYEGLVDGINKWQPQRGAFSTCASLYIRSSIQKGLRSARYKPTEKWDDSLRVTFLGESKEESKERDRVIYLLLTALPDRERFVIHALFFMNWRIKAVAECLGVKRQRVEQIRNAGLVQLRHLARKPYYQKLIANLA